MTASDPQVDLTAPPQRSYAGSVLVELLWGTALMLGYRTRFAALVLALFCVVTAMLFHNNFGDQTSSFTFSRTSRWPAGFCTSFGSDRYTLDARRS